MSLAKEKNEIDENEFEEYDENTMVLKHLAEEPKKFENQENPNLEQIETMNLGDEEIIKETKISVHLTKTQQEDLGSLLKQ